MKNLVLAGILAFGLFTAPTYAQVIVHVGPPPVVVERPGPPPGAGYAWTGGYHRWNGQRYVWVPGRYMLAPRPHAVWVPARWVRRRGGWFFVEGHWR